MRVELLSRTDYAGLLRKDLELLHKSDITKLRDIGDLQATDLLTAKEQLIASREKSLAGSGTYQGADYTMLAESIATLPGSDDALYLMRLKSQLPPNDPKPAKGNIPRAKQELTRRLDLPTRRYIHTLKLVNGKFEDLRITRLIFMKSS